MSFFQLFAQLLQSKKNLVGWVGQWMKATTMSITTQRGVFNFPHSLSLEWLSLVWIAISCMFDQYVGQHNHHRQMMRQQLSPTPSGVKEYARYSCILWKFPGNQVSMHQIATWGQGCIICSILPSGMGARGVIRRTWRTWRCFPVL